MLRGAASTPPGAPSRLPTVVLVYPLAALGNNMGAPRGLAGKPRGAASTSRPVAFRSPTPAWLLPRLAGTARVRAAESMRPTALYPSPTAPFQAWPGPT